MTDIKKLDSGEIVLSNASYLHITPYADKDTLGTQTYDLISIVGDSLSFTPDDNTTNSKEWEFGDTPLVENTILGKIQFAANCTDFQNVVLKEIFGWTEQGGVMYAPKAYKDIYAVIEVGFHNEDVVVVAPRVRLNSKATIGTLKTGTAEGNLAGTLYTASMKTDKDTTGAESPMAFIKTGDEGSATYTVTVGDSSKTFTIGEGVTA